MTVAELIVQLQQLPAELTVYRDGGEFRDNWVPVSVVEEDHRPTDKAWRGHGVFLD